MEDNLILKGRWEKADWSFHIDVKLPTDLIPTAVVGLSHYQNDIVIVKTKRGWELPGGHIESGEDYLTSLKRELEEEVGIKSPTSFKLFGYTKIKNTSPVINKGTGVLYPQNSCILYFLVESTNEPTGHSSEDSLDYAICHINDEKIKSSHMRDQIIVGHSIHLYLKSIEKNKL